MKRPSIYTRRIPSDFITLCHTYSELTIRSNRAWLATGFLSLVAITSLLKEESRGADIYGWLRIFSDDMFFPYPCFMLSLANFHFLVLISQCFQMQFIFMKYLHDVAASEIAISKSINLKELAHHMNKSGYNRFVPAIMELKVDYREQASDVIKPVSDFFYLGFPAAGVALALLGIYDSAIDWSFAKIAFVVVTLTFAALSLVCSALGFVTATQARQRWSEWIEKQKEDERDKSVSA